MQIIIIMFQWIPRIQYVPKEVLKCFVQYRIEKKVKNLKQNNNHDYKTAVEYISASGLTVYGQW